MIYIDTDEKFIKHLNNIEQPEEIGVDVEASGLDPYTSTLLLVQIGDRNEVYVINAGHVDKDLVRGLLEDLKSKGTLFIAHNAKYDLKMLYHNYGILLDNVYDTMYAQTIHRAGLTRPRYSYKYLVGKYIGPGLVDKEIRNTFIGKTDFDFTEEQINYSAADVQYLFTIMDKQNYLIDKYKQRRIWGLEMEVLPVVALMEYMGVGFDQEHWLRLAREAEENIQNTIVRMREYLSENFYKLVSKPAVNAALVYDQLLIPITTKKRRAELEAIVVEDEIISTALTELNMGSPKQMLNVLRKLKIHVKSTNQKEVVKFAGNPFVDTLLDYRKYSKRANAFGKDFLEQINTVSKRIHSQFNQLGARTGRFGSSGPNLQNIIKDMIYRECFVARDGYLLLKLDYSQIELRILAQAAMEPLMIQAYQRGEDIHQLTASIIRKKPLDEVTYEERGKAKNVNFAVVYGSSAFGLYRNFGIPVEEGKEYLKNFFEKYTHVKQFIEGAKRLIIRNAYSVTLYGRRRYFTVPIKKSYENIRELRSIGRKGVNHIIQGSSADMLKIALKNMYFENPFGNENFHPVLTVHDEIVYEFREDLKEEVIKFVDYHIRKSAEPFLKDIPVDYSMVIDRCWLDKERDEQTQ